MVVTLEKEQIPTKINAVVPGCAPFHFGYKDVNNREAWLRLCKGSPSLRKTDFNPQMLLDENGTSLLDARGNPIIDHIQFKRYWLLSSGLYEGNAMLGGKEGSGKSLFGYHLGTQLRDLFGKKCTLNRKPEPGFGEYDLMTDEEFKDELKKFNEIVAVIERLGLSSKTLPLDIRARIESLKFYNRFYMIDEGYREIAKDHRTNRSRAYGELVRQWRHLHTLFCFISPDPSDFDRRLVWERRTHEIRCDKRGDTCYYTVWWLSPNIVKSMELVPAEWAYIWDSYNLIGSSIKIKI